MMKRYFRTLDASGGGAADAYWPTSPNPQAGLPGAAWRGSGLRNRGQQQRRIAIGAGDDGRLGYFHRAMATLTDVRAAIEAAMEKCAQH
jgi:hypothetical protein